MNSCDDYYLIGFIFKMLIIITLLLLIYQFLYNSPSLAGHGQSPSYWPEKAGEGVQVHPGELHGREAGGARRSEAPS